MKHYYVELPKRLKNAVVIAATITLSAALPAAALAQAPTVSYISPQTYTAGTAIAPLTPTSSGVGAPGYSGTAVEIGPTFVNIQGLAIDAAGNIYVADAGNDDGLTGTEKTYITMLPAGNGTPVELGYNFDDPTGVAVDAKGNVYVADEQNNAVKMIPAGNGTPVSLGSGFRDPTGVAVDAAGNIYVADYGNNAVKKMPPGGGTPVVIGSGFLRPMAVAADGAGNVYVADYGNNEVKEIPGGTGTPVILGSGFSSPEGVAVDIAGNVYVADLGNAAVKEIPAGSNVPVTLSSGTLRPAGIAIASTGVIYVSDASYNQVQRLIPDGGYFPVSLPTGLSVNNTTGVISGTPTASTPAANYKVIAYNTVQSVTATINIAIDPLISYPNPPLYVVGNAITPLAPTGGGVTALAYSSTLKSTGLPVSGDVAFDRKGNLYVADLSDSQIVEFPVGGGAPDTLYTGSPVTLVVDAAGNIYTADQTAYQLIKIPAGGGTPVKVGSGQARFVAADAAGNIYYTDNDNNVVWELYPNGSYIQFATGLNNPEGIAVDAAGNVYVGNNSNQISKIPAGGGTPVVVATGFNFPEGMAFDAGGNLYIADASNNMIKEIPAGSTTPVTLVTGISNPEYITIDPFGNLNIGGQTEISPTGGYFLFPMLPAGLKFSSATGIISGTPTAASAATNYTITGYNAVSSSSASVNITVRLLPPATISYNSPQNFSVGSTSTPVAPTSSGVGVPGYSSSPVVYTAGFSDPQGIAVDAFGNVYVSNPAGNLVMKIPVSGGMPVSIGSGFKSPYGIAVDAAGNVYVADLGNMAVKKIPAGGGSPVSIGSGFSGPIGVAVDAAGNVYEADQGNNAIYKIPFAGGSYGTPVSIASGFTPQFIAVDSPGNNVYATDFFNNVVYKIPVGGGSLTALGSGFNGPTDVAVDEFGNVFVADYNNNAIKEIPVSGGSPITLGSGFSLPAGLAMDGAGNIYVSDYGNSAIKQIDPIGGYFISPSLPAGLSFSNATGAIGGTPTSISPATNYTVTAYNAGGPSTATVNLDVTLFPLNYGGAQTYITGVAITPITPVSSGVAAPAYSSTQIALGASIATTPPEGNINGVASDAAGNLYEISQNEDEIFKIPAGGSPTLLATGLVGLLAVAADAKGNVYYTTEPGSTGNLYEIPAGSSTPVTLNTTFSDPVGVAVDAAGNIYVADAGSNNAVEEYPANGRPVMFLGVIKSMTGIAVDGPGNVYVVCASVTNTIYKIPMGGGTATAISTLFGVQGVAIDGAGDVFTTAGGNVYEIPPGGNPQLIAAGDGNSNVTGIFYAIGVTTDGAGNVYAINNNNNPTLGEIKPTGGYFITPYLPAGLSFNNATGVISGTPVVVSPPTTYTINAYNGSGGSSTATISITVNPVIPTIAYSSPQTFQIGLPISPALAPASTGVSASGYSNAPLTLASIEDVGSLALDAGDNVYTVGFVNNSTVCVCKITPGKAPVVLAGYSSTGPYASAVTADASGNVYYTTNNAGGKTLGSLYRIAAGSTTSVLIATSFYNPYAMVVDSTGNVYVADNNNGSYLEEFPGGHGPGTLISSVANINYLAADRMGNLYYYCSDADDDTFVCKLNRATGVIDTITNSLNGQGLALDGADNIYTTQSDGLYELPAGGSTAQLLAADDQLYNNGPGIAYRSDLAIDASGNLYVINGANNHPTTGASDIVKLTPTGGYFISPTIPAGVNFNYSTGIISGTPTALSTATNYTVTAYNNYSGVATQTINMQVASSANANLSKLTLSSGTLSPVFASGTTSYTASVINAVTSITLTPTATDVLAAITVNGASVISGKASQAINLNIGTNVITTAVTSQDGTTTKTYTVTVTRPLSGNANLTTLTLSNGALSPAFASGTTSYTASVGNGVNAMTVTPATSDATATVTVNGTAVTSGSASQSLPLVVGPNTITLLVTAQNGTTKIYTIVVTEAASTNNNLSGLKPSTGAIAPGFSATTTAYTETVNYAVTSISITPSTAVPVATIKVNGTTVTSGTASGAITLAVGANTITTVVTAQSGVTKTYTLTVTRSAALKNAQLSALSLSSGTLSPSFAGTTIAYTASVANGVSSITLSPTTGDVNASVTVNGAAVMSGAASQSLPLVVGPNTETIVVTAQDGVTKKTYTVVVTEAGSSNANLSNVTISNGTLSPAFAAATINYNDNVGAGLASMTVTPTTADPTASITVNGTAVSSGSPSQSLPLVTGANTISIVVAAQDGVTTKTYTITVTEAKSTNANLSALKPASGSISPVFSATTTSYTETVNYAVTSFSVTPTTAIAGSTVTVNGTSVASGTASQPITLSLGTNTITTVVTAQDGVTTKTYTLTVTRSAALKNAQLSALALSSGTLSPVFASTTTAYTASVPNGTSSFSVTPTTADVNATVTVNGSTVTSGTASQNLPLVVGPNTITIAVTAQDGKTVKTYTVTVTEAASSNASLSAFKISNGALTPAFATGTTSYTANVANGVAAMTVTPTTADPTATITVNGIAVTSGSASQSLPLVAGPNTITTVVTAADGVTTKTYTLVVTEAKSTNANLAGLKPGTGSMSPAFSPTTTTYTESVANTVATISITPTTAVTTSTVKVNGTAVTSGTASGAITLAVGANTITTVVTAQDGVTAKTYTLTVTRAAGGADDYNPGISVTKPTETPALADDGIVVHQGVSPNGDGINDFLQIDNIVNYPDNKLSIMNRNGQLVYETTSYDNSSKVFDGHSSKNGQMQLPGTYFYQLDYTVSGITKHKTGFIVLKY